MDLVFQHFKCMNACFGYKKREINIVFVWINQISVISVFINDLQQKKLSKIEIKRERERRQKNALNSTAKPRRKKGYQTG